MVLAIRREVRRKIVLNVDRRSTIVNLPWKIGSPATVSEVPSGSRIPAEQTADRMAGNGDAVRPMNSSGAEQNDLPRRRRSWHNPPPASDLVVANHCAKSS